MKNNDSHIHIGQFYEQYYSPEFIANFLNSECIQKVAISSTTTCEENYKKVIAEMKEVVLLAGEKIYPVLWITPIMLKENKHHLFLKSKIRWNCTKIHGFIHNWHPNGKLLQQAIDISTELNTPILFHTGGRARCDAGAYLKTINRNPDQIFILAHGRPIEQAIEVLRQCSNAWVDTAFMPYEDLKKLEKEGFIERTLFGTDFPITTRNEINLSPEDWYRKHISEIVEQIGVDNFKKISEVNFNKLFNDKA